MSERTPQANGECRQFSAPLGSAIQGRLVFVTGAAGVTLHVDPTLSDLFRAHFERHIPDVTVQNGVVRVRYQSFSLFNWLVYWREPVAEITLNASIPWEIEIHGGASKLTADLRGLHLTAVRVEGGASGVTIVLPAPRGTVPVSIGGGASNVTLHRPAGTALRFNGHSGASNLALDEHYWGAIGGKTQWETPAYADASDRYDVRIGGGASNLTVDTLV